MIGYVYKTTNLLNNRMYIGQHRSPKFDITYYGSGEILKLALKKYGKKNFKVEVLYEADSIEELNQKEIEFIKFYKNKYGDLCYNIAQGGEGGNVLLYKTEEEKLAFVKKMTEINQKRCKTKEFRDAISKATKERYSVKEEREKHSKLLKEIWDNDELKIQQSQKLSGYYKKHEHNCSFNYKRCAFQKDGTIQFFDSVKDLRNFLKKEYNYIPDRRTFKKLMENGAKGIPYKAFHKAKSYLNGMLIYYLDDNVETNGDECNRVGNEISTFSKDEAQ